MMMLRKLALTEYRVERGVPLSIEQREALRQVHPGLHIEPTPFLTDRYDLTADHRIGIIGVEGLMVEIRPKVPMSSVLFLVSYACDAAKWFDEQPTFGEQLDFVEILAIMLARLVEQATRGGLLNGYQTCEEALASPRGRVLFDEQLRRRSGFYPPLEVRHDEYTADILENRVLLAGLSAIGRVPLRSDRVKREIARARRLFGGVTASRYSPTSVPDVAFTRLNRHYQPPIALAKLILRSASLDLGQGGVRGSALLVDMNVVFEKFIRIALRTALDVGGDKFPDKPPGALRLDAAAAIPLAPDLCLVENGRIVWVGDAKYKRLPAGAYNNADIYQLLAYSTALGLPGGTLIYAADEGVSSAEHVILRSGKRLRVVALDLTAPTSAILEQVGGVAERIAGTLAAGKDPLFAQKRPRMSQ